MSFAKATNFPPSCLTCERYSDQGYVEAGLGRLACLGCSAAVSSWIPASQPPVGEPVHGGISIQCLGAIVIDGGLMHDLVAYWPARDRWTATRFDGMEPTNIEVEVSHYMELPELPKLHVAQVGSYVNCLEK